MHEMGIALQIIEIAQKSIPADMAGSRVVKVNLTVGKLAAVVPDSLRFCFEVATQDTPLAGAKLIIDEKDVVAQCNECHNKWTIEGPAFSCPACSSGKIKILSGRELDIQSIEIAERD